MTKLVTRRRPPASPEVVKFVQFLTHKKAAADATKAADKIKAELQGVVDQSHSTDPEKGHLLHTLPEELDFLGQRYTGFMRQRKVTSVFHEDRAEALCVAKGFDPDDYTTRYVDQDKIARLFADEKITDEEFDALSTEEESWAFVAVKE